MKLIIASNNAHKIYEIKKILSGKFDEIISLREAGIFLLRQVVWKQDGKPFFVRGIFMGLTRLAKSWPRAMVSMARIREDWWKPRPANGGSCIFSRALFTDACVICSLPVGLPTIGS